MKDSSASLDQVPVLLDQLELRLKEMKDRCDESVHEELETVASCKRRVDHLMQVTTIMCTPFSIIWKLNLDCSLHLDKMQVTHQISLFLRVSREVNGMVGAWEGAVQSGSGPDSTGCWWSTSSGQDTTTPQSHWHRPLEYR